MFGFMIFCIFAGAIAYDSGSKLGGLTLWFVAALCGVEWLLNHLDGK